MQKLKTIRDETGLVTDYEIEGDYPKFGNNDDRADDIGIWLLKTFISKVKKTPSLPQRPPYYFNFNNHI